jgi:succinoglycan biosynthesis protein ExoL
MTSVVRPEHHAVMQGSDPSVVSPRDAHRDGTLRRIAFFGHDSTESTIIKRLRAFQNHGSEVVGFMFRRPRGDPRRAASWDNVELGTTFDRSYLLRVPKLLRAVRKVLKHREYLCRCEIFYARNIDMLLVAVLSRVLSGSTAIVVYEVLDVQRAFVGHGLIGTAFRAAERVLLDASDLLVVSSPDFIAQYFAPVQKYRGPWRLLENKLSAHQVPDGRGRGAPGMPPGPPWIIAWLGALRCRRSLEVLCRVADQLGSKVEIRLRGIPSPDLPLPVIEAATAGRRNIVYGGPYVAPCDLADIYSNVHFTWCVDYLDAGGNSDWLLPNRVYEGGLFGALALARAGTATGRMVEREALGWTFAEPLEQGVTNFLGSLGAHAWQRAKRAMDEAERSLFVDETDTRDLLKHLDSICSAAHGRQCAAGRRASI